MTLLSTQPKSLESAPVSAVAAIEDPEQRMLEKRSKVIEELLQTEKDYIKDLQMCVFLDFKAELEEVYKIYCQNHDDAISLLEMYEKDESIQRHVLECLEKL
ncbi:unnamed protein product, partial [Coregonus sp. 'balchen']